MDTASRIADILVADHLELMAENRRLRAEVEALTDPELRVGVELQRAIEAMRKDAERYRKLADKARQRTGYDVYGNGCSWGIGFFCEDSRLDFEAAVDALPAVGAA